MKKLFYALSFAALAVTIASVKLHTTTQDATTTPENNTIIADSCSTFATSLYSTMQTTPGNIFFSPYSIFSALSMTYAGARGQTEQEIKEVLSITQQQSEFHPTHAQAITSLNQTNDSYQLTVANKLFVQASFEIKQTFRDTITTHYGDLFEAVDFNEQTKTENIINSWVADKTNNKIPTIVDSLPALTRLVLVNAIYFKGDWVKPFAAEETHTAPFYATNESRDVEMMQQTSEFAYFENDELQLIELPYKNSAISMFVILPTKEDKGTTFYGGSPIMPDSETLRSLIEQTRYETVFVRLPKFKLETNYKLKETLSAMGMPSAFDDATADFSGLTNTNGLFLYDVIHKAFVEVAEEGTEAAAATGVIAGVKSIGAKTPLPKIFNADHPFPFVIQDTATQIPLFIGRYEGP